MTANRCGLRTFGAMVVMLALGACGGDGGDGGGATVDVDLDAAVSASPADPVCVWNHAYRENGDPDSIEAILAGASGCYVLLDPFDEEAAADAIPTLKAAGNTVGCYVSTGTCEDWRDDFDQLEPFCADTAWEDWEGEFFVSDTDGALPLMRARIDRLGAWGCDFVEFDNMDWAEDDSAVERFDLQVDPDAGAVYNSALCDHALGLGMQCMAKNTALGADDFTGGTFESFSDDLDWWDSAAMQRFVDAGQLTIVFHYDESDCDSVALWYRQRYGSGVSFLCESGGGYVH